MSLGLREARQTIDESKIRCIPLDHPIIARARGLVDPVYWDRMWVAGSAAARYGQNKDVDIWVEQVPESAEGVSDDGHRLFRRTDLREVLIESKGKVLQRKRLRDISEDEYEAICQKIYDEDGLHIMAFHETMQDVLNKFDISVHSVAFRLNDGQRLLGSGYQDKLTIHHVVDDTKSLARYFEFARRYQDFDGLEDQIVRRTAADVFNLQTYEDMQRNIKYLYVDRGL